MAKQKQPTGGEKIDKLDGGVGKIVDTGKAITHPLDGKTGPAAGDKAISGQAGVPKNKPSDAEAKGATKVTDLEKKKKVAEALIGLEDMDVGQMESLSNLLNKFKIEAKKACENDDEDDDDKEVDENDDKDVDDEKGKKEVDEDDGEDDEEGDDKECDGTGKKDKKGFPFKKEDIKIDMSEDTNALFEGQNLSNEFKNKATTIFESAVRRKIDSIVDTLKESYSSAVESGIEESTKSMETKLSSYLQYVSEEFMKENELAIESGIRTEIAEDFISGFKALCEEHSIDIPAEKMDALEESQKTVKELESKLSNLVENNVQLKNQINESIKATILTTVGAGLADTEKEKLAEVCESIDFESKEDFTKKATILKESYFPNKGTFKKSEDIITEDEDEVKPNSRMGKYTAAISHDVKND